MSVLIANKILKLTALAYIKIPVIAKMAKLFHSINTTIYNEKYK
jgi:hypothetical protein